VVIFYAGSTIRAADRAPQQGLGMQQRPEPHCQAAHAAAGRARAVAGGNGIWSSPGPCLNHLSSFICYLSMVKIAGEFRARSPYGK
jgi:hypothetical protein